jgi:hypothetical protein
VLGRGEIKMKECRFLRLIFTVDASAIRHDTNMIIILINNADIL